MSGGNNTYTELFNNKNKLTTIVLGSQNLKYVLTVGCSKVQTIVEDINNFLPDSFFTIQGKNSTVK